MKKAVTFGLAAIALALPLTYVIAGSRNHEPLPPVAPDDVMPGYELFARLRLLELEPQGEPLRRGPYYVLHAADTRGRILRVVADAELGDILSIAPARAPLWQPQGAPRIIHVPDAATIDEARIEKDTSDEAPADVVPPRTHSLPERPTRRVHKADLPRRKPYQAAKPAPEPATAVPERPAEHRTILSAPPPAPEASSSHDALTPVYPTPRFGSEDKAAAVAEPPAIAATPLPEPDASKAEAAPAPQTEEPAASPPQPAAATQQ